MNLLARNKPVLQGIGVAILTFMVPGFVAWAISAGAAAIATLAAAAPLIIVGAAIAALAALVIIHFDTIRNAIMTAFNWVKDNWPTLLAILTGPIGIAVLLITQHWDTIKAGISAVKDWIVARFNDVISFVTGLPGAIASAASGMWDGIKDAFVSAINAIIRLWNGLSFPSVTVGGGDPLGQFGPSLPEVTIGGWELPNIPELHSGGTFKPPAGQSEGLALLRAGEVFTPEQVAASARGAASARPAEAVVRFESTDRHFLTWFLASLRTNPGARQTLRSLVG